LIAPPLSILLYAERLPTQPWDQLLAIGVLVSVAAVPVIVRVGSKLQKKRTNRLREAFGPDYEASVQKHGNWRRAESELLKRLRAEDRAKAD
jgi:hypothetical protein